MYNFITHKALFYFQMFIILLKGLFVRVYQAQVPMEVTSNVSVNSFHFKEWSWT